MSLLGWQMLNNGAHWASDYPLGIAMGYLVGKISTRLGRSPGDQAHKKEKWAWNLAPGRVHGVPTMDLHLRF